MASSKVNKKVFDPEEALATVKDLRTTFDSGKTQSYEWRVSQLKALLELTEQKEQEIVKALYSDLSKSEAESYIQEVCTQFLSINY
jgi:aldehyde dehydrogenase (NAD+)